MNDHTDSPKYSIPPPDHSGLEAVPLSHLEPAHQHQQQWTHPPQDPSLYPALNAPPQKEFYGVSPGGSWAELPLRPGPAAEPKERILGLSVKRFWMILIVLVVIIAVAIGAGVGAGLATRSQADSSSPATSNQAGSDQETNTSSGSSGPASDTLQSDTPRSSASTSTKADAPTQTTSTAKGGVSPIPTDGGCPKIDGTDYTPTDGKGKEIPLGADKVVQTFVRHCETNWPAGGEYGNPRVHDIMKFYVPSLEDCITACASYNRNYEENIARGIGHYEGGLCRAVTVVKTPGEYCYLKNNTGKMLFFGDRKEYSSAVLVDGD